MDHWAIVRSRWKKAGVTAVCVVWFGGSTPPLPRDAAVEASTLSGTSERPRQPARPTDGELLEGHEIWVEAKRLKGLQTEESLQASAHLLERAASIFAGLGLPEEQAGVLIELGDSYSTMGRSERADASLERAVSILDETDSATLVEALNSRADFLVENGDSEGAEPMYLRALELAHRLGNVEAQAVSWNGLGVVFYYRGDLERVVEAFERALQLQRQVGETVDQATTLANLGSAYRALGRYSDALEVSEAALALARQSNDKQGQLRILNSRGVWLKAVGDVRAATDSYLEALELIETVGARDMEATVAGNLGSLYRILGRRERARDSLDRALQAARETKLAADEAWVLLALGEMEREAGDPLSASDYYRQARLRSDSVNDRSSSAYSLLGLGRSQLESERPDEAAAALGEALALFDEISDRPGRAAAVRELAKAQAVLGATREAEENFRLALSLANLVGDPLKEAATRADFAEFLSALDRNEEALPEIRAATMTLQTLRQGLVQPDVRASLQARTYEDFALMVEILAKLEEGSPGNGHAEEAFLASEKARARSLVELLAGAGSDRTNELPPALVAKRRDLAGALTRTQRQLTEALKKLQVDPDAVVRLKQEISDLNRQREDLERETRLADPRWQALRYPAPLDVEATRRLLAPRQALVSFVLGKKRSFGFVVSRSGFALTSLTSESEISDLVARLRRDLGTPGRRSLGRLTSVAAQLYDTLLRPLERDLEEVDHLLVVPDGPLHYLPFEALVTGGTSDGGSAYVLSKWAVSYVPSGSTMDVLARRRAAGGSPSDFRLAAFADPDIEGGGEPAVAQNVVRGLGSEPSWEWAQLVGARAEVEAIAKLFDPAEVRLYLDGLASESTFKSDRAVREATYLHIASHSLIDDRQPALSALLLAPGADGEDDGLLQTHEIFDLELSAELVVLSGCETALGKAVRGEGLQGLTRAFLYAGASAVSVSLWPVEDDSTAHLMTDFYRGLSSGETAAEALRRAKLTHARRAGTGHPYYWAPFIVVGDAS
jgi:CHAT domain-containing protein/Tfp pilus assembly protein PilF